MPDPIPPFEPPLREPSTVSAASKATEEASCPCACHVEPRPILHIRSCCPAWNGALDGAAGQSLPHIEARVRREVAEELLALADAKHPNYTPERFDAFLQQYGLTYPHLRPALKAVAAYIERGGHDGA